MKAKSNNNSTCGGLFFDLFREWKIRLNPRNGPITGIKIGLGMALVAALSGCVGWVDGGGGYGGAVVVPGPDIYLFGGGYERGRDVREYSHRGFQSHATMHSRGPVHGERR